MASIKVTDVLFRVSTLLLDTKPQFLRFTERELVTWLNDGQRAIAKYIPFAYTRIDVIKLVAGSKQSIAKIPQASIIMGNGLTARDMIGNILVDVVRNMGANGITVGRTISVTEGAQQDAADMDWHSNKGHGQVEHFIYNPLMPKDFYVVPAVSPTIPTWVEVAYMASPIQVLSPDVAGQTFYTVGGLHEYDLITLDDQYLDELVNYIMARCYTKDAEYASNQSIASMYTSMFAQSINALSMTVLGVNPNLSFLPFAPNPIAVAK